MNVEKGAIYGFVGRNGAGKTTLIRTICGLQAPSQGTYTLLGRKHNDPKIAKSRRKMGAVIETPSLYRELNARENLEVQLRMLGLAESAETDRLLALCGSGWRWRWLWQGIRIFLFWMSRSTAWIRRASSRSGN